MHCCSVQCEERRGDSGAVCSSQCKSGEIILVLLSAVQQEMILMQSAAHSAARGDIGGLVRFGASVHSSQ